MSKVTDIFKVQKYEKIFEAVSWLIIIIAIFAIKFFPTKIIEEDSFYILYGLILSFLIVFYYFIWRKFPREKRLYIQNIAEVILIGLLIHFTKDLGIYFYSLFLLPIVATALTLEMASSVLIVILACVFIAFETIVGVPPTAWGYWQLALVILFTVFSRFLALEIRHQRELKERAEVQAMRMKETEKLNKEFITLTSHQLFTPLSIIRGFVSLLKSEDLGKLDPKQKEPINQIYDNTIKMVHLVSELLTVSRVERGKLPFNLQKTNLLPLLKRVSSSIRSQAEAKNLYLKIVQPDSKNVFVNIDQEKIENVLLNLLDNAIKYTKKGGITIKTELVNGEVLVSVIDTGVGIPKEYKDRIFVPFFRGKNILELDKRGTGLGLYIAKSFVEKQGGKMWAESEEGKGSKFIFSLPLNKSEAKNE